MAVFFMLAKTFIVTSKKFYPTLLLNGSHLLATTLSYLSSFLSTLSNKNIVKYNQKINKYRSYTDEIRMDHSIK